MTHFLQFFYAPPGEAFYRGNVYGNIVAVSILAPAGYLWSRTRFWPLRPIKHALTGLHSKLDAHHQRVEEHNEWVADHIAAIHRKAGLGEPEPHPHFDLPAGEPIRANTDLPVEETT